MTSSAKNRVREFWEKETCGTRYGRDGEGHIDDAAMEDWRREHEHYIDPFAQFDRFAGKRILEIGVGGGMDFVRWARVSDDAFGIDLTDAAVKMTHQRLRRHELESHIPQVSEGDSEHLEFPDEHFDLVYSWGVLHHTPDTGRAFREAYRVLKPGARLKAMVYNRHSWTAAMVWIVTQLRQQKLMSVAQACRQNLESHGTKVLTTREMAEILSSIGFTSLHVRSQLAHSDLLEIEASEKHRGRLFEISKAMYPRPVVRLLGDRFGLNLLIDAEKA